MNKKKYSEALEFAGSQVKRLLNNHPDYFPLYMKDGRWKHEGEAWTRWGEGYLGGQIWIMAIRTGDRWWRQKAEHYSRLIEPRKNDKSSQSMWSLFWPTYKRWYDYTGEEQVQGVVLEAGRNLAGRFKESGGYLASFVDPGSNLIDNMMSVGIIFYTAQQLEDRRLMDLATRHCLTTRRYNVRGDGSIIHESLFDPDTGECIGTDTHQGWRPDSSWTRGQAWAIYGFGNAFLYRRGKIPEYRHAGCRLLYGTHPGAWHSSQ